MNTQEIVLSNLERLASGQGRTISEILRLARVDGSSIYGEKSDCALDVNAVGRIADTMKEPLFAFFLQDEELMLNHAEAFGYKHVDQYQSRYENLLVKYGNVMEKIIALRESAERMKDTANERIEKMHHDLSQIIETDSK